MTIHEATEEHIKGPRLRAAINALRKHFGLNKPVQPLSVQEELVLEQWLRMNQSNGISAYIDLYVVHGIEDADLDKLRTSALNKTGIQLLTIVQNALPISGVDCRTIDVAERPEEIAQSKEAGPSKNADGYKPASEAANIEAASQFFERGVDFYNAGRHQEALTQFCQCISLDNGHIKAKHFRGVTYLELAGRDLKIIHLPAPPMKPHPQISPTVSAISGREEIIDGRLYRLLRDKRKELADDANLKERVYLIFSNKSLRDMALKKPKTECEFLDVFGVGEVKLEKYGKAFMDIIIKYSKGYDENDARDRTLQERGDLQQCPSASDTDAEDPCYETRQAAPGESLPNENIEEVGFHELLQRYLSVYIDLTAGRRPVNQAEELFLAWMEYLRTGGASVSKPQKMSKHADAFWWYRKRKQKQDRLTDESIPECESGRADGRVWCNDAEIEEQRKQQSKEVRLRQKGECE